MAAFLRASLRVGRNIAFFTPRNHLSYLRHVQTPIFNADNALCARVTSTRLFSDVIPNNAKTADIEPKESSEMDDQRLPLDKRPSSKFRLMSNVQYDRMIQKLGTISTKGSLFQLFDSILAKDGKVTQLQAYQMLRNCGKELMYESPQSRTDMVHVIWDKLLASGIQADIMMYNALVSVYLQNDYDFNPLEVLEQIQSAGLEPNLITMTLVIKEFGQKGDIAGVFKVLEFMKTEEMPVTEPVYAALILAYWRTGDIESAKGVFNTMRENGLDPGLESYTTLLRAYAEDGDLVAIDETISEMQEKKVFPNHTVYLSLIDVFAKCGKLDVIPKVRVQQFSICFQFSDILSMMLSLGGRGDVDAALVLMDFVPTDNISSPSQTPQSLLLKQIISAKLPIDKIMKVVDTLNKQGIMRKVYETALDLSYGNREPGKRTCIIIKICLFVPQNVVVKQHYFYPILACYADNLDVKGTQDTFTLMADNGLDIDPISLSYVIKSFGQPKDADVDAFIKLSKEIPLSPYLVRTIAQLVMESGHLDKLENIFEYAESSIDDKSFFPQTFGRAMKRLDICKCNYVLIKCPRLVYHLWSFDPHNAIKSTNNLLTPTNNLLTPTNNLLTPTNNLLTPTNNLLTPTNNLLTPTNNLLTVYQQPTDSYQQPTDSYQQPTDTYQQPTDTYQQPTDTYQQPTDTYQQPTDTYQQPTDTYQQPTDTYQQPTDTYQQPTDSTFCYTAMYISDVLDSNCKEEHTAKQGAQFIHMILQEGLEDLIDSRSYTAIMKYLNMNHLHDEFYELIRVMKEHKIPLDEYQYRQMIRMFSYLGESRAAQFCFNNFKKLKEPDDGLYSLLISAYGHSKDGGFLADRLKDQNPQRILKIYEEMKELGILPKSRAKAYLIMSFLAMGNLEEATVLKEEYGHLGPLAYRVETAFLKAFADKGDTENAARVLEVIKNTDKMFVSAYSYTMAISAYKHNGDVDSQRKLLQEMKDMNIKPTSFTYDELMGTYLL
ncbi:hypothetical protein QZH41_013799, partial [Actinostola sp. cb2023]